MDDEEPLQTLPGPWASMLRGGQVLTALILSTSYSEKYKGRYMQRGAVAELRLPAQGDKTRTIFPRLLCRSGNKEAVAFIWLGDDSAQDHTLYVTFSPLRYRSQFCKIYCAGIVQDGLDHDISTTRTTTRNASSNGEPEKVPISAYVYHKLKKLWGKHGLWNQLSECVDKFNTHSIIFSGISHGAALAQAAALQFRLRRHQAQVFVVTWNAYRWTNEKGRALVEKEFGDKILPFALSRRSTEPQATRYWDSVTGFPGSFASMPNSILLDADSGHMFNHTAPHKSSHLGAHFLMRMFELHFAKAAINATKKATSAACGGDQDAIFEDEYFVNPFKEAFQDKVLETTEQIAQAGHRINSAATGEIRQLRRKLSTVTHKAKQDFRRRLNSKQSLDVHPTNSARQWDRLWWRRLAWCCSA